MKESYMLPIQYCQYHACRWSGDLRSHDTSRQNIDQTRRNVPYRASEEFNQIYSLSLIQNVCAMAATGLGEMVYW